MKEQEAIADSESNDEDTITHVAMMPAESAVLGPENQQLDASLRTSCASYSLSRLEHDLKSLQLKWQIVEREMLKRDEKLAVLQSEVDAAEQEKTSLAARRDELEHDLQEQQSSATAAKDRLTEIEARNTELGVQLLELQEYIDARKSAWDELNVQLQEYADTNQQISRRLEGQEAIVAVKEEEKAALSALKSDLEDNVAELSGRLRDREASHSELQAQLAEQSRELGTLNGAAQRLQSEIDELRSDLQKRDANVRSLEQSLEESKRDGATLEESLQLQAGQSAELEKKLDASTARIDELESREARLDEDLAAARKALEAATVRAGEQDLLAEDLEAKLAKAHSEQADLSAELEAQLERVQALEDEVSAKQSELDVLDDNAERLSAISTGIREIDFLIDEHWSNTPAEQFEDSEKLLRLTPEDTKSTPEKTLAALDNLSKHVLVCEDDDLGDPIRYRMTQARMIIGRSHKADIRLNSKYISREHACLTVDDSGVVIEDVGSMNGFLINSEPTTRHRLAHGDRLQIGENRFQYIDSSRA